MAKSTWAAYDETIDEFAITREEYHRLRAAVVVASRVLPVPRVGEFRCERCGAIMRPEKGRRRVRAKRWCSDVCRGRA